MSHFLEGQTHQLMEALQAAGYTAEYITKLGQYPRLADFRLVLDGRAEITRISTTPTEADFIVKVPRIKPNYPIWMKDGGLEFPNLELADPEEFNLLDMGDPDLLKTGKAEWRGVYEDLKAKITVGSSRYFNLLHLLGIQSKGVEVFRAIYGEKFVFGPVSTVRGLDGFLHMPYIFEGCGDVILDWLSETRPFEDKDIFPRFKK
jgi:hypothetical protein